MWHTDGGDRALEGAEARLFAEALWDFVTYLEVGEGDYDGGIGVFDRLTYGQKISLLSIIATGLLKLDEPPHKLTAVVEGAIAAVFSQLKTVVILEIEEPSIKTQWRKMILAARREAGANKLPKASCGDEREWFTEIEALSDLILWDADYESEDLYIDKRPEEAQALKDFMGVSDDYFRDVPEDLNADEIKMKLAEVTTLCRSISEKTKSNA
jgi:hypothetical protein